MKNIQRKSVIAGLLFQLASPAQTNDAALLAKAKGIHERVLKL